MEAMLTMGRSSVSVDWTALWDGGRPDASRYMTAVPFVVRAPLADVLEQAHGAAELRVTRLEGNARAHRVNVRRELRSGRQVTAEFTVWPEDDNTAVAVTCAHREAVEMAVLFVLSYCYPALVRPAVTASDLSRMIKSADEDQGWSTRNRLAVGRPSGQSGARIERKSMKFAELEQELADHDRTLDSIRFLCVGLRGTAGMEAYVSRQGIARLYSGEAELFSRLFVEPIRQRAAQRSREMAGRNKTTQAPYGAPLTIDFGRDLFVRREELERLCGVLSRITDASVSVFHLNPHLHVSVLDYADASTLDVCMIGPSALRVIPGYRSSEASLVRVCDAILTEYEEGTVVA